MENEVVGIDTVGKRISVRRIDGTEYTEHYDKLLLSPGSAPMCPPIKGIETEGIFTLRNVEDTDRIKNYLDTHEVRDAVVVGGGFIGLEMAENLHNAGIPVSIIEMAEQVMAPVDFSIASHVHRHLLDKGMSLYLRQGVERFERLNNRIAVYLSSDEKIEADMVLLSIGVRPVTDLAVKAGIDLGERGIKVNAFLETSAPDVYAVGDAIEFTHPLTGKPWLNYLAGPANRQGRIVADNMVFGNQTEYEGAIGTAIAKVFDLVVGTTGLPAKRLKQMGVDYRSSTTVSLSHAGYYPGAFPLTLKLTFSPTDGRLFGAQCVGNNGVDKRIDQIAQIIKQGGTVYDLIKTEQCYAPPFSSAKDPIAIAGYAASNIISGAMPVIDWRKLRDTDRSQVLLLDMRTPAEFELGTIEGAVNIPLDNLRERICEIPRNKKIVIFCAVGLRGYLAQRILMGRGYADVWNLSGGYQIYSLATMPVLNVRRRESSSCPTVPLRTADECRQVIKVDACGLQCPGPIMKLKKAMDNATVGDRVEVQATDAGFPRDAGAWCKSTGNKIVEMNADGGYHTVVVEKASSHRREVQTLTDSKNKTLIMFSDDLDRALATFVLANGAAATGHKVSVFFTFWGLNVIKRERKPAVKKDIFGRMFSWMMPSDSRKLRLSQMSMLGLGDRMMRYIMKKKNIDSLEKLRQQALDNGVEFIACQMSMDMMGVQREELIDGVTVGGVATYMERAENANVNLFI